MAKVELTIKRTDGITEVVNMTARFTDMNTALLARIRKATKEGGRGDVLYATVTRTKSNAADLRRAYANLFNEGGEGYEPDTMTNHPEYREWTAEEIIK